MPFISVTRLRVRSIFYLPQFVWKALVSARQAERAPGFVGGRIAREARNTFWTITVWQNAKAMKSFRDTGKHQKVMPKLMDWCDEASVVHWDQQSLEIPDWPESYRRMAAEGRASKVNKPSQAHLARQIVEPQLSGNEGRVLKGSSNFR